MSSEKGGCNAHGKKGELYPSSRSPQHQVEKQTVTDLEVTRQQVPAAGPPKSELTKALERQGIISGVKAVTPPSAASTKPEQELPRTSDKGDEENNNKEYFLFYKGMKF